MSFHKIIGRASKEN